MAAWLTSARAKKGGLRLTCKRKEGGTICLEIFFGYSIRSLEDCHESISRFHVNGQIWKRSQGIQCYTAVGPPQESGTISEKISGISSGASQGGIEGGYPNT